MLSSFTKQNTLLVSSNLQTKEKSGGRILKNLSRLKLATKDMSDMLRVFLEDDLSEFFYYKDCEDWLYEFEVKNRLGIS